MIKVRRLNSLGLETFKKWLDEKYQDNPVAPLPADFLTSDDYSEKYLEVEIDESRTFASRFEFGEYIVAQLGTKRMSELLSPAGDLLWAWLSAVYFSQLGAKRKREEHYIVDRAKGRTPLVYRNGPRTCYEFVAIHGSNALIALSGPMKTFGEMTEQLASRQTVARNRAYFRAATAIYMDSNGKLKTGANAKPVPKAERKPEDKTGRGSSRRLAIALKRLDLAWDTEVMSEPALVGVLPKEFDQFAKGSGRRARGKVAA